MAKRNYQHEAAIETDARRAARAQRLRARRLMIKDGLAKRFDHKDVGHVKAISKGGTNALSNLQMQDPQANRSFKRNSKRKLVSEISTNERKGKMR